MSCERAQLAVLDKNGKAGDPIPVQFNPTTMSLQMANSIDGTKNKGRQTRKYTGTSSTTLSLDLEFDTADEGTDVRKRTAEIAQFVLPSGERSKKAPPRVRFCWGTFELSGIMSSLSEELSYFSSDGTPLRAKLSVEIKEQDPQYAALESGAGSDDDSDAPAAGSDATDDPAAPGSEAAANADRAAETQDDESPADFLARNGLAPEAWRALGGALDALSDGVGFEAGLPIAFPSSLALGGGVGVTAGFQAGLGISTDATLGLRVEGKAGGGVGSTAQGKALAAAGGLTAASETASADASVASANDARSDFGLSERPSAGAVSPTPSASSRGPLAEKPSARTLSSVRAAPAPPPPTADRRSRTYGAGVPLRDRVTVPGSVSSGWVVIGRPSPVDVPDRVGRSRKAPWEQLGPSRAQAAADHEQRTRHPDCGCHRCDPHGPRGRGH